MVNKLLFKAVSSNTENMRSDWNIFRFQIFKTWQAFIQRPALVTGIDKCS